jgi:uncharacterized membrane protein YjjP (DUF1212 family)
MFGNLGSIHLLILMLVLASIALVLWAIVTMTRDSTVPAIVTVLWALVMLLVPGLGIIAWAVWWYTRKHSRAVGSL